MACTIMACLPAAGAGKRSSLCSTTRDWSSTGMMVSTTCPCASFSSRYQRSRLGTG